MTVLDELADFSRQRVSEARDVTSLDVMKELALQCGTGGGERFVDALRKPGLSFICEIKKASPSKGIISSGFPYLDIAKEYESAGADAVSCLTEPRWFMGSDEIFKEVRAAVSVPMLRKDFTVDEYQIYEARVMNADAVLLICSLLDKKALEHYINICNTLGLAALVETHNEDEIALAVSVGAGIIGVNNRNLKDFSVDLSNSLRLRDKIPDDVICVAESGVRSPSDVAALYKVGADAVLIGEAMMRARDKGAFLASMREAAR